MDTIRQRFGANLRRLIEERGLTFEQVGLEALGYTTAESARVQLSKLCSGSRLPQDPGVEKLMAYLGVEDISEFFKPLR